MDNLEQIANLSRLEELPQGAVSNSIEISPEAQLLPNIDQFIIEEINGSIYKLIYTTWVNECSKTPIKPDVEDYFSDLYAIDVSKYIDSIDLTQYINLVCNGLCAAEISSSYNFQRNLEQYTRGLTLSPIGTYSGVNIITDPYIRYDDAVLFLQKNKTNVEYYYNYDRTNNKLTYYMNVAGFDPNDIFILDFISTENKYRMYLANDRDVKLNKI